MSEQLLTADDIFTYDYHGALDEVNRSNYSKFEDGKAVRDEHGKIAKGKDYFRADLERFVCD